jgi:hypothetical protein
MDCSVTPLPGESAGPLGVSRLLEEIIMLQKNKKTDSKIRKPVIPKYYKWCYGEAETDCLT